MSVIRSTSSPEGLYIWQSNGEGGRLRAEISWTYRGPLAKGRSMSVPWDDFRTVVLGWLEHSPEPGDERCSNSFSAVERQFTLGNGACAIIGENSRRALRIRIKRDRPGLEQIEELLDMMYEATEAKGPRLAYMHIANRFGAALSFKPSVKVP